MVPGVRSKSPPFTLRGALKGFVVSGRWPNSTKEWAQLLMVAVRVASLPGLLSTTTIFGVREELPDRPQPGTVGLVLAEGTSGRRICRSARAFRRQAATGTVDAAPAVRDHAVAAGMFRSRIRLRSTAGYSAPRAGAPRRVGRGRIRRHDHQHGEPGRRRPDQPPRYRDPGDAAGRIASFAGARTFLRGSPNLLVLLGFRLTRVARAAEVPVELAPAKGSSPQSDNRHTGLARIPQGPVVRPASVPVGETFGRKTIRGCRPEASVPPLTTATRTRSSGCSPRCS